VGTASAARIRRMSGWRSSGRACISGGAGTRERRRRSMSDGHDEIAFGLLIVALLLLACGWAIVTLQG
jgi:hypothetical protein